MIAIASPREAIFARSRSIGRELDNVGRLLAGAGHELALTGGAVRNTFLGAPIDDFDFSTDATSTQIVRLVAGWADQVDVLGNEAGTVRCSLGALMLDITPYCTPTVRSRAAGLGTPVDLAEDLRYRDFTINAIAYHWYEQRLFDPHGGVRDLAMGRLRTPRPALGVLTDRPLRIIRAARFSAEFRLHIAPELLSAMSSRAVSLAVDPSPYLSVELGRLLSSRDHVRALDILRSAGAIEQLLASEGVRATRYHADLLAFAARVGHQGNQELRVGDAR